MIVEPSDFVGKYAITNKFNDNNIQQLIDDHEETIIYELLGVDLGNDLLTNIGSLTPELQFIFNPFAVNVESKACENVLIRSLGMPAMLLHMLTGIYYLDTFGTPTSEGKVKFKPEGGNLIGDDYNNNYKLYNTGIRTYRAIQKYIKHNKEDYPTFEGIDKQTAWII